MKSLRGRVDRVTRVLCMTVALLGCALILFMLVSLATRAMPVLRQASLRGVLLSDQWQPLRGQFGLLPFVAGTVSVSLLGLVIGVPVSLLTAIFLSEYAPRPVRAWILPLIDVLSGIPSVIYGVFGILVIVPLVCDLAEWQGIYVSGYSLLSGGLVLAIMISPFIIHMAHDALASVPQGIRDASLSLGATRWQTVKHVVLRAAGPGILAAVMLGLARALGETIAVLMVVGNVAAVPRSLWDPVYPLPALLANNYGEMMSIPLYDSALMLAALALLVVVLGFNLLARGLVLMARRRPT